MHDAIFASLNLAGIDGHGTARIDDDDAPLLDRLGAELCLLLVHRGATQIRHPMVQEIVGLVSSAFVPTATIVSASSASS